MDNWSHANQKFYYLKLTTEVVVQGDQLNYTVWGLIHVWWCDGRVGILAHCMQLIAFLHKNKIMPWNIPLD